MNQLAKEAIELQVTMHNNASAKETIVLLHGWGSGEDCWGQLLPALKKKFTVMTVALPGYDSNKKFPLDVDLFFTQLIKKTPKKTLLMGWSLGGLLATKLAAQYPENFSHLITLGTNPYFIAGQCWPGMEDKDFSDFEALTKRDASAALPYFSSLESRGEKQEKKMLRVLRANIKQRSEVKPEVLNQGLQWLRNIDVRDCLIHLTMPSLHVFAANDALVPISVAEKIKPLNDKAEVFVLPEHGHRFFYFEGEPLVKKIEQWLDSYLDNINDSGKVERIDQQAMIRSFNKAAKSYDDAAHLQKKISNKLLEDIKNKKIKSIKSVVDVGCGTGHLTDDLHTVFSEAIVYGIDISKDMVAYASDKHKDKNSKNKPLVFLQGSAEALPVNDSSIDLITANFSLQWCDDLSVALSEMKRTLKKEGNVFFTLPIEGTFDELAKSWAQVDDYRHVNDFIKLKDLVKKLQAYFPDRFNVTVENYTEHYKNYFSLAKELKALGVTNVNRQRLHGLTGPSSLKKVINAYEAFKNDEGLLPVSWVVATVEIKGE